MSLLTSKTDVHSNWKCKILFCKCDNTNFELVSKFTSYRLYYRKLSANSPQGYLPATDVYSNCDAVIYNGFALAN